MPPLCTKLEDERPSCGRLWPTPLLDGGALRVSCPRERRVAEGDLVVLEAGGCTLIALPMQSESVSLPGAVAAAFAADGALARAVEGYEPRPGQRRMADAVAAAI